MTPRKPDPAAKFGRLSSRITPLLKGVVHAVGARRLTCGREMRAVILAGGRGTRLRPYTTVLRKPLVPIGERPILELILHQLSRAGFHAADLLWAAWAA